MRGSRMPVTWAAGLALAASGLSGVAATTTTAWAQSAVCDTSLPTYGAPVRLGTGTGYEPGIRIDSAGTIFYTAHKVFPFGAGVFESSETRTASWLYRSTDNGQTWEVMNGLNGAWKTLFPALEGDIAIDAKDRMYFVDTWAADNHLSRWSDHGATLDFARHAVATYEVDDRPWITAHGDGYVYYMSNTGYKHDGRLTIHRSTDGGMFFDPVGFTFPESGWGTIDADPNSAHVYAFVNDRFYPFPTGFNPSRVTRETLWISADRGETWRSVKVADVVDDDDATHVDYPQVAVSPADGTVYTLWGDGKTMKLGRSTDHGDTWETLDITPFEGDFDSGALTVGRDGTVAVGFHHKNRIYATLWRPDAGCLRTAGDPASLCAGPASITTRVATESAPDQEHFFQIRFSPDGALNRPYENTPGHNKFVRQASGPNMSGAPFCGHVVVP